MKHYLIMILKISVIVFGCIFGNIYASHRSGGMLSLLSRTSKKTTTDTSTDQTQLNAATDGGKVSDVRAQALNPKTTDHKSEGVLSLLNAGSHEKDTSVDQTDQSTTDTSTDQNQSTSVASGSAVTNVSSQSTSSQTIKQSRPRGLVSLLQNVIAQTQNPDYQAAMKILNDQANLRSYRDAMNLIPMFFLEYSSKILHNYSVNAPKAKPVSMVSLLRPEAKSGQSVSGSVKVVKPVSLVSLLQKTVETKPGVSSSVKKEHSLFSLLQHNSIDVTQSVAPKKGGMLALLSRGK